MLSILELTQESLFDTAGFVRPSGDVQTSYAADSKYIYDAARQLADRTLRAYATTNSATTTTVATVATTTTTTTGLTTANAAATGFSASNSSGALGPPGANQTAVSDATALGAQYAGIVGLNLLSALFSGLVLGLLSLDMTELEILRKCGTELERKYASSIIPMRRCSNLLLCSLVIGNVVVNTGLQMLLDTVFPGLIGFISTTVCITIFGEIVPQAICARHGLAIGAKTIWITWIVIVATLPVAYPLSLLLDVILGEEIAFVYDRERLQEYIRLTRGNNNFDPQEINIITGALKIKKVTVSQVMTKLKDVFMLPLDTIIYYQTIMAIVKRGFSRIPVYDKSRRNLIGLLMVKDLALVNPYAEVTLKSLILFYKHPLIIVDEGHTLDVVFNHFREGKSHMAFVREHKRRDIIGIVTLEDIVEEVLQVEINDETDIVTDNRELKLRPDAQIPNDLDALHAHLHDAIARRRVKDKLGTAQKNLTGNKERNKNSRSTSSRRHEPPVPRGTAPSFLMAPHNNRLTPVAAAAAAGAAAPAPPTAQTATPPAVPPRVAHGGSKSLDK